MPYSKETPKVSKPKGSKPKAQFHGIHTGQDQVPGASVHAGYQGPHFVRQATPGPHAKNTGESRRVAGRTIDNLGNVGNYNHQPPKFSGGSNKIPGHPIVNAGHTGKDSRQTSTFSGGNNKIAGQDNHAMPFQQPPPRKVHRADSDSDIWVRIKTVESDAPRTEETQGPNSIKLQQQRNQGQFSGKKRDFKRLLEYNGRDLSLTDLLPPTLGIGTLGILDRYSTSGRVSDSGSSTSTHQFRKVRPAVQNGLMFIPTQTRPRPVGNSFAESPDSGPPNARKTWTVDLGNYRDDEVSFTLEGVTLMIEGKQSTRQGQARTTTESIELPTGVDIDFVRVYRKRQMGALIIAYIPTNQAY